MTEAKLKRLSEIDNELRQMAEHFDHGPVAAIYTKTMIDMAKELLILRRYKRILDEELAEFIHEETIKSLELKAYDMDEQAYSMEYVARVKSRVAIIKNKIVKDVEIMENNK